MNTLNDATREKIEGILGRDRVVLFMKGSRQQPMCGFSAAAVSVLDGLLDEYTTVDVLQDEDLRAGIKAYGNWPTIPQLYIAGELIGGNDVIQESHNRGELHALLGLDPPDRTPPTLELAPEAAAALKEAVEAQDGVELHLAIDPLWRASLTLATPEAHEIRARAGDVDVYMDLGTAQRANGLCIEAVDTPEGTAFRIDNPNAPNRVKSLSVRELKALLDDGSEFHLFDVRSPGEREIARIPEARALDREAMAFIAGLPRDAMLVFHCHTGARSQTAAEHFAAQGFVNVYNLSGGIEAWSVDIDPTVPRY